MVAKTTGADLAPLIDAREHDNDRTISLMDHLPEVFACVGEWPLGYDVSFLLLVALREGGGESCGWEGYGCGQPTFT